MGEGEGLRRQAHVAGQQLSKLELLHLQEEGHGGGGGGGGFETPKSATKVYGSGGEHGAKTMVLLEDVHSQLSKERGNYERLLIQLLQSTFDLASKEEEVAKFKRRMEESEKGIGRVDDKVLMQLSKKLETLLIDNEDLREQNERLLKEIQQQGKQ